MIVFSTLQVILLCVGVFLYGFAAGYVLKATVLKNND